jgi:hypothetical protein
MHRKLLTLMQYYTEQYTEKDLFAGMMIEDIISGDVGILVKRYDVMACWELEPEIWAWEIIWTGPATHAVNKNQPYTENGLLGMLNAGRVEVCNE